MSTVINEVRWRGRTGVYDMKVYAVGQGTWNDVPGVYIFCNPVPGGWRPIYIGQCDSFRDRLTANHHKWPYIAQHGATQVHAMVVRGGEVERRRIEADLLAFYNTPCNDQLN